MKNYELLHKAVHDMLHLRAKITEIDRRYNNERDPILFKLAEEENNIYELSKKIEEKEKLDDKNNRPLQHTS